MTARILCATILSLIFFDLAGQEVHHDLTEHQHLEGEQCGHMPAHERRMQQDQEYREEYLGRQAQFEVFMQEYNQGLVPKTTGIITIPVVVHIIHDGDAYGTGSNITDEQVYSAINALNQDYRKMPGTFGDGEGVDIEVEFCLAQQDPDGNATTGINRVNGCSVPLYCTEGITSGNGQGASETGVKNLSRWPNQQYYNIWVVTEIENNNGGSGIQGYAYFPTTSQVDGTVVLFNAFGTVGNLKSYTNRNRTLTHELGHAFALFHTFQGGTCSETNCNLQGDRVCDTPPTTLNSSCSSPACGGTQLVENYMDYTSQTCKDMFTQGQKDRMRAAITNSRTNLMNSTTCEPVTVILADAAITEISEPFGNSCTNMISPVVKLENAGSSPLSTVTIQYRTGGSWINHNWTGLLGSGQSVWVTLPAFDGGWGQRTLEVRTNQPNGNSDSNTGNNLMSVDYNAVQNGHTINLSISIDALGSQTTWLVRNSSNETLASGGPYANFQPGTVHNAEICVDDGCYDFVIMDSGGNGICCSNGSGSYSLTDEGGNILASGGNFGNQETTNFCLSSGGNPPVANFSVNNTSVCQGQSLSFTNLTTGDVDSYDWKFFGGTPFTVTTANPGSISYNTPGTYDVRLAATNAYGEDVELKSNYITVNALQTWYADNDGDGHGNPASTVQACSQPTGYVALGDDCNDNNAGDWNSCYDCAGVMNGPAQADNCGTCDTNPNNDCVQDCAGTWGGNAVLDNCGTCDTNPNNNCVQDCAGNWGGSAVEDNCGTCDSNPNNDCVQDCAGVWGGSAVVDNCGTCDTNPNNDCVQDCAGVWGGTAVVDNCGTCDTNPNNDCVQDCAGTWGGTAYFDECGTCDDIPANDCVPCDGVSITLVEAVNPSCHGLDNGSIELSIETNTSNFTLVWNTGQTGNSISGLEAGVYQATLTEDDCSSFISVTLTEPAPLNIEISQIVHNVCDEENSGSAMLNISGGTEPYTTTIDQTSINDLNLTDLGAGIYSINVIDAQGCTAETSLQILQLSCDSLELTQIVQNICSLASLGFSGILQCEPVENAEAYIWEFSAVQNSNQTFTVETALPELDPQAVPDIQPNIIYAIRVKAFNTEMPSAFGETCDLNFVIDQTQLISENCNRMDFFLHDQLTALTVAGSSEYEFRFEDALTLERFYYYGNNVCALADVEGLELERVYRVQIRSKYRNIWGSYGEVCELMIIPFVATTALTEEWCENYFIDLEYDVIFVQPIENATVYQLKISGSDENQEIVVQSTSPSFAAASFDTLNPNTYYQAQARALTEGNWTPWGSICTVAFTNPAELKLNMLVYPNPVLHNNEVNLQTKGNWENLQLKLCNMHGVEMKFSQGDFEDEIPKQMGLEGLAPGVYFLQVSHGKQMLTEKVLIQ